MQPLQTYFELMHDKKASDLHLAAGNPPILRVDGQLIRIEEPVLDHPELTQRLQEIISVDKFALFEEQGDIDFGYEIEGLARYRVNFFKQKYGIGAVFREIPADIQSVKQLGLPEVLTKLALLPRGLILLTGPTGSGKSTTLAAIVDAANNIRSDHIITIEDPIEYVHQSKKCIINHREVGLHTQSFSSALRSALREDPDIILVGEMRDLETIALAIEAAATGHLVLSTVHTSSAAATIDRIIEVFPSHEQALIRLSLADSLRAIVAQTLFKRADRPGRVAATEILIATPAVRNLIREAKSHQISSAIQTGKRYGMRLMDDSIMALLDRGMIDEEEAYLKCHDKERFRPLLTGAPADFTEV